MIPFSLVLHLEIAMKQILMVLVGSLLMCLLVFLGRPLPEGDSPLPTPPAFSDTVPDFGSISDVALKKRTFFDWLYPLVVTANLETLALRREIETLHQSLQNGRPLSADRKTRLDALCEEYRISPGSPLEPEQATARLLKKVDLLPPSLAMAQAANETAWGTSRFATKGNNFFGQWCFTRGCGLVPLAREKEARHEVKVFSHPIDSVRDYLKNVNRNPAYGYLRGIRAASRQDGLFPDAEELAVGLGAYSERGEVYIRSIQAIIRANDLGKRDARFAATLPEYAQKTRF